MQKLTNIATQSTVAWNATPAFTSWKLSPLWTMQQSFCPSDVAQTCCLDIRPLPSVFCYLMRFPSTYQESKCMHSKEAAGDFVLRVAFVEKGHYKLQKVLFSFKLINSCSSLFLQGSIPLCHPHTSAPKLNFITQTQSMCLSLLTRAIFQWNGGKGFKGKLLFFTVF